MPAAADTSQSPALWVDPPSRAVLSRANQLLARRHPERRYIDQGLVGAFRPITFTYAEWREAQAEAEADYEAALAAYRRKTDVRRFIKTECEAGRLHTRLRKVEGGDYSEILPRSWWRTEDYTMRFVTWKMHPTFPFVTDAPAHEMQWIFMIKDTLDTVENRLKRKWSAPADQTKTGYESEYMGCARLTIAAMGITADNMPKKAAVEAEIPNHWTGQHPLSPTTIRMLAGFIRSEASRDSSKPRKK